MIEVTGHRPRVLVVDDEASVLNAVAVIVDVAGFDPNCALSAEEAFDKWDEAAGAFDLLVVDYQLGGSITGLELAERLGKEKSRLEVVVISAYPLHERFTELKLGENFFQKPFDVPVFIQRLKELVERKQAGLE